MQARTFIGLTAESVLRPAEIFPVSTTTGDYNWQWQAEGGAPASGMFELFFDCLQDARTHGYEPQFRLDDEEDEEAMSELLPCPQVVPIHRAKKR